jgi:hypothetical protein
MKIAMKLMLADLDALAHSPASDPVLYLDEAGNLEVGPASAPYVPAGRVVLTQMQMRQVFEVAETANDPVSAQWDALDAGDFTRGDVLEALEDDVNDSIEEVLADRS